MRTMGSQVCTYASMFSFPKKKNSFRATSVVPSRSPHRHRHRHISPSSSSPIIISTIQIEEESGLSRLLTNYYPNPISPLLSFSLFLVLSISLSLPPPRLPPSDFFRLIFLSAHSLACLLACSFTHTYTHILFFSSICPLSIILQCK